MLRDVTDVTSKGHFGMTHYELDQGITFAADAHCGTRAQALGRLGADLGRNVWQSSATLVSSEMFFH